MFKTLIFDCRYKKDQYIMNCSNDTGNVNELEKLVDKNHVSKTTGILKRRKHRHSESKASYWSAVLHSK